MWGRTFDAHVHEEEGRAQPSDFRLEGFPRSSSLCAILPGVLDAVDLASFVPECEAEADELEDRGANLSMSRQQAKDDG